MNNEPSRNRTKLAVLFIISDLLLILTVLLLLNYGKLGTIFALIAQYSWFILLVFGTVIAIIGILSVKPYNNTRAVLIHGLMLIINSFWYGISRHPMLVEKINSDIGSLFIFGSVSLIAVTIVIQIDVMFSDRIKLFLTTDKSTRMINQDQDDLPLTQSVHDIDETDALFKSLTCASADERNLPEPKINEIEAESKNVDIEARSETLDNEEKLDDYFNNVLFIKEDIHHVDLDETHEITEARIDSEKAVEIEDVDAYITRAEAGYTNTLTSKEILAARVAARAKARSVAAMERRKSYFQPDKTTNEPYESQNKTIEPFEIEPLFIRKNN